MIDVSEPPADEEEGTGERYTEALSRRSNISKAPFCKPQKTILDCTSGTSRSSLSPVSVAKEPLVEGTDSSPLGGIGILSPKLDERMGEFAITEEIQEPVGTSHYDSHSFRAESRDVERIFLPTDMMPVEVTERV